MKCSKEWDGTTMHPVEPGNTCPGCHAFPQRGFPPLSLENGGRWFRTTSRSQPCPLLAIAKIYPILARTRTFTLRSVPEALHPCMPGRAVTRDWQTLETPHLSLWPLVFLILWNGRTHVQLLPVSSSLEILRALIPSLTSCCIWEGSGKPQGFV